MNSRRRTRQFIPQIKGFHPSHLFPRFDDSRYITPSHQPLDLHEFIIFRIADMAPMLRFLANASVLYQPRNLRLGKA